MTLNEYQNAARRTQRGDLTRYERMHHALFGMASEVGEIHAYFQKVYQGHEVDDAKLRGELGDLIWFVAEFADARGWTLESVARYNIGKLWRRFPAGFDSVRSRERGE